jgi:mRNA interferase MazF
MYVPDRGDAVWITFDPQAGHEQAGRRPAIVLSRRLYNNSSQLALFCPITTKPKGYPFEVAIPDGQPITGVVLADQVRNFDWKARKAVFICRLSETIVAESLGKMAALLK